MRSLWKGLTPFATHLTLKYALRMGTNATYQSLLRDQVCKLSDRCPARIGKCCKGNAKGRSVRAWSFDTATLIGRWQDTVCKHCRSVRGCHGLLAVLPCICCFAGWEPDISQAAGRRLQCWHHGSPHHCDPFRGGEDPTAAAERHVEGYAQV